MPEFNLIRPLRYQPISARICHSSSGVAINRGLFTKEKKRISRLIYHLVAISLFKKVLKIVLINVLLTVSRPTHTLGA